MHCCILTGSPRANGNTAQLLRPFIQTLEAHGCSYEQIRLADKRIEPCTACRACQQDWSVFGCRHDDDLSSIFERVLACNLLVLATPIYSWYCTPPMKALLDRLVYGMNKYYGIEKGPSLWEGKPVALVATCGYRPEQGADLWEAGIKRYCKHSRLHYLGMLCERDPGYGKVFWDAEKEKHAVSFAEQAVRSLPDPDIRPPLHTSGERPYT